MKTSSFEALDKYIEHWIAAWRSIILFAILKYRVFLLQCLRRRDLEKMTDKLKPLFYRFFAECNAMHILFFSYLNYSKTFKVGEIYHVLVIEKVQFYPFQLMKKRYILLLIPYFIIFNIMQSDLYWMFYLCISIGTFLYHRKTSVLGRT